MRRAVVKRSPARPKSKKKKFDGEALFLFQCKVARLQTPVREVKFSPVRNWRLDFAFVHPANTVNLIAMEIECGVFSGGRHTRG